MTSEVAFDYALDPSPENEQRMLEFIYDRRNDQEQVRQCLVLYKKQTGKIFWRCLWCGQWCLGKRGLVEHIMRRRHAAVI